MTEFIKVNYGLFDSVRIAKVVLSSDSTKKASFNS